MNTEPKNKDVSPDVSPDDLQVDLQVDLPTAAPANDGEIDGSIKMPVDADSNSPETGESGIGSDDESNCEPTVESLQAELADAEKRVLLAQADLENFRRRTRRDMQDQLRYASIGLIAEVLDSVDNLNRAVEAHEKDPSSGGLAEGVALVAQQISNTLQNQGCQKIEAVGQPFDPSLHQAVQMQPSDDVAPNTVLMDLRPGFQLHDRVIRPSQVFVSTSPEKTE